MNTKNPDVNPNTTKKEHKERAKKPRYYSQEGFVTVELLRGFDAVSRLFHGLESAGTGCFICGGYARWCASPRVDKKSLPGDVDVYCPTEDDFTKARQMFEKEELEIRHENELAITYKLTKKGKFRHVPGIQLIKPVKEGRVVTMGTMEEILSSFDFTVVRAAITGPHTVLVDADFMHDEEVKILRIKNIHCPVSSTLRCVKYAGKGYWLPLTQVLGLFLDWEGRSDDYRMRLIQFIKRMEAREELTKEEINELEAMMRRD